MCKSMYIFPSVFSFHNFFFVTFMHGLCELAVVNLLSFVLGTLKCWEKKSTIFFFVVVQLLHHWTIFFLPFIHLFGSTHLCWLFVMLLLCHFFCVIMRVALFFLVKHNSSHGDWEINCNHRPKNCIGTSISSLTNVPAIFVRNVKIV